MGSEQRRLTGFVLKIASADQEDLLQLGGVREDDEPPRPCDELALSAPSPSGSVLSYAES